MTTFRLKLEIDRSPDLGAGDWCDRVLDIWVEDDAPVPDKEVATEAFARITGSRAAKSNRLDAMDHGDCIAYLHRGGWVLTIGATHNAVGVVVKVRP